MKKLRINRKIVRNVNLVLKISVVIFTYYFIYLIFNSIKLYSSNEKFLIGMLHDSNYYTKYESNNIVSKVINYIYGVDVKEPLTLIENSIVNSNYIDEEYDASKLSDTSKYILDPNPTSIIEPIVYIYNSHQLENYDSSNYEAYNITPNVMMASYMMREKLNELGIPTIVEDSNITEYINMNNWNYNYSYLASRYFIDNKIKEYPSLRYFIDIHRDSIKKDSSTVSVDNNNCAKVLFVVGLEHQDYKYNLDLANKFNSKIIEKYPNLSRGVITKEGKNVNGIYNQDVSHNAMLIEIGGYENKIEEVSNTIDILSNILKEIINE